MQATPLQELLFHSDVEFTRYSWRWTDGSLTEGSLAAVHFSVAVPPELEPSCGRTTFTSNPLGAAGARVVNLTSEAGPFPATFTARTWKAYLALARFLKARLTVPTPLLPMVFHAFLFSSEVRAESVTPRFP